MKVFEAKEGSQAFNYIKGILDAEEKEKKEYFDRVEQAVGFKVGRFNGYVPNSSLGRTHSIETLRVPTDDWEKMDHKPWTYIGSVSDDMVQIKPNGRTKAGKHIRAVMDSCRSITTMFRISQSLGIDDPSKLPDESGKHRNGFEITQLVELNGRYFIALDDRIRADKQNDGLVEIPMGKFEDLLKAEILRLKKEKENVEKKINNCNETED